MQSCINRACNGSKISTGPALAASFPRQLTTVEETFEDQPVTVGFQLGSTPVHRGLLHEVAQRRAILHRRTHSLPSVDSDGDHSERIESPQHSVYVITKARKRSCIASGDNGSDIRFRHKRSFSAYMSSIENASMLWKNLTSLLSYIYAIFVVVFGGIFTMIRPVHVIGNEAIRMDHVFIATACFVGLFWLLFLHCDLTRYERRMRKERNSVSHLDSGSLRTDDMFNWFMIGRQSGYSFLTGRHSGSFYLKVGMTVFCCGHLIHEGLLLGQEIIAWMSSKPDCGDVSVLTVHIITPIFSFYQLFFMFKYSNIVINRFVGFAQFGIMHCIATSLSFWFSTIVDDAYGDFVEASLAVDGLNSQATNRSIKAADQLRNTSSVVRTSCSAADLFSPAYLAPMPYLYPFTIEFNLLLAGVWFIILQNLGQSAQSHEAERRNSVETVENNFVISADCHSANRGIFLGFMVLLVSLVILIVFFVTSCHEKHLETGTLVYHIQDGGLMLLAFVACLMAYTRVARLDVNGNPITLLDDFLLFIPLPFYFAHAILVVMAEIQDGGSTVRIVLQVLSVVQVITQTPLIIAGLRRCSNCPALRYEKPGREVISFLIVLNITMWIVYTFETKTAGRFFMGKSYYGLYAWIFVEHTTVPLMLFYRFHSSVCLADIWKSAYETE
ncbi:proton channel OtopLc-like [Ornithodoros turicata]|uniref:proton channel OtopLc-like n=1 Tax=Ornithodoros turicata TaxID=34597 RepID=UPI0031394747